MSDTKIGNNPPIQPGIAVQNQNQPKSLDQGKRIDDRQYIPAKYKEVAANMEQQFAEMMVEQMSRTVEENPEDPLYACCNTDTIGRDRKIPLPTCGLLATVLDLSFCHFGQCHSQRVL